MEYQIVHRDSLKELQEAVAAFVNAGWIPAGGVTLTYRNQVYVDRNDGIRSDPELLCAQAITRSEHVPQRASGEY